MVSQFRTKVPFETECINPGLKARVNRHRIKTGFSPDQIKIETLPRNGRQMVSNIKNLRETPAFLSETP